MKALRTAVSAIAALLAAGTVALAADTLKVNSFRYSGPVTVTAPHSVDSLGTDGKPFGMDSILGTGLSAGALRNAGVRSDIPASGSALHLLGFGVENRSFAKIKIGIEGLEHYEASIDGTGNGGEALSLDPGTHEVVIKCLTLEGEAAPKPEISVVCEAGGPVSIRTDGGRIYSLDINTRGETCSGLSLSPSGKLLAVEHTNVAPDGSSSRYTEIVRLSDGAAIARSGEMVEWMPGSDAWYYTREVAGRRELHGFNPLTSTDELVCPDLPEGEFRAVPGGKYLIFDIPKEGPKEGEVHEILCPDDRQPGWRDRSQLARFDLGTGLMQPLTFGFNSSWLLDISADGSKILFGCSRARLTARPTSLFSVYEMNLETLETKCLVKDDGFIQGALFSPDGSRILVSGFPEAFGGVGNTTPEGRFPSMVDGQLFVVDCESLEVTPITRDFDPCVLDCVWSRADGNIYLQAEVKDLKKLFRCKPAGWKFEPLGDLEEYEAEFTVAEGAPVLAYRGESLENGGRVYSVDLRKNSHKMVRDFSSERLEGVTLGKGDGYEFTSSRGDLINCFYVLPPDFDPAQKYPMLVHYYGGCSPSSRYCIGSYSPQYYAAQGFIFLVVNPSGASGFGQEFSSRHVNTAGEGVAEDIIEATQRFCADHPFVDAAHIGCFSASYGGFMTQLLLCKTDIYATGISHAGISDHTSYWGEGYWGYNYSEVSMAESYPWTRKDLYVDRSPLYNADKIHTPLLFLHGSADTNVPIGESIQMFTALKLLGEDTAFVVVDGENHGIREYSKRRQWLRTISAWFSKYLKEDPSWWDELYPPKNL